MRVERVHQRRVHLAPDDGRGAQGRQGGGRNARQAPVHHLLHPARHYPLREARRPDSVQSAGGLRQGSHDLDDEERDALGLAFEQVEEVGPVGRVADHGLAERGDLVAREAREAEQTCPRDGFGKGRGLVVAEAPDKEERQVLGRLDEPRKETEALAAGPVEVLQDDDQGKGLKTKQLLDRTEQPRLSSL